MRSSDRSSARAYRALFLLTALLVPMAAGGVPGQQADGEDWIEIRYGQLVDRRELSHSGDSVGALLRMLDGRPLPSPGERPGDRLNHVLLDPLTEPYAFALQDAIDSMAPVPDPPMVEVGRLWQPGERQPAWVELLRARRYLVESDGRGRMRVCIPVVEPFAPGRSGEEEIRKAVAAAWPVLRHLFAAERKRLAGRDLTVRFHVYRHFPARSLFLLGARPLDLTIDDTRASGHRPPLDLESVRRFLESGLQLEGARLESDGRLLLIGSPAGERPGILGRPLELSDLAVAYRAVFHGGLAEPYMSLDRGPTPQTAKVNYGGRLRDTALGMVSLLCDIRFKTFSLGLGIAEGRDLRESIRSEIPSFRSHLERFAAHPQSEEVMGQQTRLWFYPDKVDLTLSAQGDAMLLRRVRMSAASERIEGGGGTQAEDPPWTKATVAAINRDYDKLARIFPELGDLDQVVRLLSLFTWLKQAENEGLLIPELDVLLALELPPLPTPRTYPQLLAYNALPAPGGEGEVVTLDRMPAAEALERLSPLSGRPLPARMRLMRALGALDRSNPRNAALIQEVGGLPLDRMEPDDLDRLAHRAERLRMHQTVLAKLDPTTSEALDARRRAGEQLRVFSVGIGGLDLGMGRVVARAAGRSISLGGAAPLLVSAQAAPAEGPAPRRVRPAVIREEWRADSGLPPIPALPGHGPGSGAAAGNLLLEETEGDRRFVRMLIGADSPTAVSRRLLLDEDGRALRFERSEDGRSWRYRFEIDGGALIAVAVTSEPREVPSPWLAVERMPNRTGLLQLVRSEPAGGPSAAGDLPRIGIRLTGPASGGGRRLETDYPRALLQRLVMGPAADPQPGRPLPGLGSLPAELGGVSSLMVALGPEQLSPPWSEEAAIVAGEENPARVARALNVWWSHDRRSGTPRSAVVVTDAARSIGRWMEAPRIGGKALLLLPEEGFPGRLADLSDQLRTAWGAAAVSTLPSRIEADLVLLASGEAPGKLAARLRKLAGSEEMQGKLLAVYCLSGAMRQDLPASLLADGRLAGIGLAESGVVAFREAAAVLAELGSALDSSPPESRVEDLTPLLLWYF